MPAYEGDDGALLHHDVLGGASSPPVILLAGGAARHPEYLGDLAGLSDQYELVVPHLRGVGRSSAADIAEMGSRWRQVDDIDRLRKALKLERCALIAHSAGTRLAVAYAAPIPRPSVRAPVDQSAGLVPGRRAVRRRCDSRAPYDRAAVCEGDVSARRGTRSE